MNVLVSWKKKSIWLMMSGVQMLAVFTRKWENFMQAFDRYCKMAGYFTATREVVLALQKIRIKR